MAVRDGSLLRCIEFYAGIGGFHYAFKECGIRGTIIASIDINTNTTSVYSSNFTNTLQLNRNICGLTVEELDKLEADVFFLSPPCQPFTRQGNKLDNADRRTDSFFHLMRTLSEMKHPPKYLLMENVKGFEASQTRNHFVGTLKSLNYSVQEFLLSPNQFGVPNSRLRFYLLAKKNPLTFALSFSNRESILDEVVEEKEEGEKEKVVVEEREEMVKGKREEEMGGAIPEPSRDSEKLLCFVSQDSESPPSQLTPPPVPLTTSLLKTNPSPSHPPPQSKASPSPDTSSEPISSYLEELSPPDLNQFLLPDRVLLKYSIAMDIVQKDSRHSCCFTKAYGNYAVGTGSVLQHSLGGRESLEKTYKEFKNLQEKGEIEGSLECLRPLQLRYFTPREVANIMCFPPEFGFPCQLSNKQCYKVLGNSLNVKVVAVLMKYLFA